MSFTIKRAYRQMLMTSSTTSVAFISNYFSQLLPVATFGIYAAIIVMINLVFAITLLPAAEMQLYYWETKKNTKKWTCSKNFDIKHMQTIQTLENFFGNKWTLWVHKWRVAIIWVFIIWFSFASYECS